MAAKTVGTTRRRLERFREPDRADRLDCSTLSDRVLPSDRERVDVA